MSQEFVRIITTPFLTPPSTVYTFCLELEVDVSDNIIRSVSICYVAVRTIVLSHHIVDFFLAGRELRLRPLRFFYLQL